MLNLDPFHCLLYHFPCEPEYDLLGISNLANFVLSLLFLSPITKCGTETGRSKDTGRDASRSLTWCRIRLLRSLTHWWWWFSHQVESNCYNPMDCSPPDSSVHGDSPGKNTGVGCHFLLQGIFPTQGSNRVVQKPQNLQPNPCTWHWSFPVTIKSITMICLSSFHKEPYNDFSTNQ